MRTLLEDFLTYLKENWQSKQVDYICKQGFDLKFLVLDTHINARYNLAKDIYTDKNGWLQLMFKMGFAI